jgi:hypothetical protein
MASLATSRWRVASVGRAHGDARRIVTLAGADQRKNPEFIFGWS